MRINLEIQPQGGESKDKQQVNVVDANLNLDKNIRNASWVIAVTRKESDALINANERQNKPTNTTNMHGTMMEKTDE